MLTQHCCSEFLLRFPHFISTVIRPFGSQQKQSPFSLYQIYLLQYFMNFVLADSTMPLRNISLFIFYVDSPYIFYFSEDMSRCRTNSSLQVGFFLPGIQCRYPKQFPSFVFNLLSGALWTQILDFATKPIVMITLFLQSFGEKK